MDGKKLLGALEKYKLPLLVLGIGLVLLLLPTGSKSSETGRERDLLLQEILSQTEGVGPVRVLISFPGESWSGRSGQAAIPERLSIPG